MILDEYAAALAVEPRGCRRTLRVFDFDDTLVKTDARVRVSNSDGTRLDLSPGEFALYERRPGDVFDYADFHRLINPRTVSWMDAIFRRVYSHHGPTGLVILSARSVKHPIEEFLASAGLPGVEVIALNDADPARKSEWVDDRIRRDGLTMVEFFDDSYKNVAAILSLATVHIGVTIIARQIDHTDVTSMLC